MTEQNISVCRSIVAYMNAKMVPINHKHLVNYVYASFEEDLSRGRRYC